MISRRQLRTALISLVAAAILLALSFMATPAKLLAQGVPLADLLVWASELVQSSADSAHETNVR